VENRRGTAPLIDWKGSCTTSNPRPYQKRALGTRQDIERQQMLMRFQSQKAKKKGGRKSCKKKIEARKQSLRPTKRRKSVNQKGGTLNSSTSCRKLFQPICHGAGMQTSEDRENRTHFELPKLVQPAIEGGEGGTKSKRENFGPQRGEDGARTARMSDF